MAFAAIGLCRTAAPGDALLLHARAARRDPSPMRVGNTGGEDESGPLQRPAIRWLPAPGALACPPPLRASPFAWPLDDIRAHDRRADRCRSLYPIASRYCPGTARCLRMIFGRTHRRNPRARGSL